MVQANVCVGMLISVLKPLVQKGYMNVPNANIGTGTLLRASPNAKSVVMVRLTK